MNKKDTIEGHITIAGLTTKRFTALLGWSASTYKRRMADPDTITIGELRRADNLVHFPDKVILDLVRSK